MALLWYFASIHLILILLSMPKSNVAQHIKMRCIQKERVALLSFKQKLVDNYDILSSWNTDVNSDCCNWRGVECTNTNTTTHQHVIGLHLHGSYDLEWYLTGEVSSSLTQLSHLNYLDLSFNRFDRNALKDISCLLNLNYLNLSCNYGVATLAPPHLGNLSKLYVLDLSGFYLSDSHDWTITINKLPALQSLFLRDCGLPTPIQSFHNSNINFSRFLVELDLARNYMDLNFSNFYSWMINSTNLVHLDLGRNNLQGLNFNDFENVTSLVFLDLSYTRVNFHSLKSFRCLSNLNSLYLSGNDIGGLLSDFLEAFPAHMLNSIQSLSLASNNLSGFLPNFTMLPSLKVLDLYQNMLSGTVPQNLGQLSKLEELDLDENLLDGEISETHFSKLARLKSLDLSNNPNLKLNLKSDWVPPFQLQFIFLSSIKLGPLFPKWLQTQNFSHMIDISFAEISDIIPHWFWYTLSPNLHYIDVSGNKIMGEIPNLSMNEFTRGLYINLESNKFVGRIPSFLFQSNSLQLSNNSFSDLSGLCEFVDDSPLWLLDLSNNLLLGQLPDCWYSFNNLQLLDLSNNYLSGDIPHSMSNLTHLVTLFLRNNQFTGGLPNLFNVTYLSTFDAMNNNFSEVIPSWIGWKFPDLIHLILKSNNFHGDLPSSLCNLSKIQVLDISSNYISGSIPTCVNNFNVLKQTSSPITWNTLGRYKKYLVLVWKHQERLVTGEVLRLEKSIDLSCNDLTGNIPLEITELIGLATLNLSNNELRGPIPSNMGQLQSLESLDLSRNHLYGPIPATLSQISTLSTLDLSYNNLSGKIPTSTQLQSFKNSSYEGNSYLCGEPLRECFDKIPPEPNINNNAHVDSENEDEDNRFLLREFLISMAFGFIVGFGGIFDSLILHRRWRSHVFKIFRNTIH